MAAAPQPLPRPPSVKEPDENDPSVMDWSWLNYWKEGGEEIPGVKELRKWACPHAFLPIRDKRDHRLHLSVCR